MAEQKVEMTVKCVGCGAKRVITENSPEARAGEVPLCEKCFAPMAPMEATRG